MNRSGKLVFPPGVPSKRLLLSKAHPLQMDEGVRKRGQARLL